MNAKSKTTRQRFRSMRRTTMAGAVLLGAYLLYQMIPGMGGANGVPKAEDANVTEPTTTNGATRSPNPLTNLAASTDVVPQTPNYLEDGVLTVLIDEHNYFVVDNSSDATNRFQPISVEEAVQLASQTSGDANGIRVRVLRRGTARAAAEHRLQERLVMEAGVERDAIYMASELVQ